jgi:hypothetical protein
VRRLRRGGGGGGGALQEPDLKKPKHPGSATTAIADFSPICGEVPTAAGKFLFPRQLAKNGISGGKIVPMQSAPGAPPTALTKSNLESKPKPDSKKRTLKDYFGGSKAKT